jgi:signal transduction histidine kinase
MVLIDENEIRQLILNMTRNGLEAMSAHGVLTIGTTEEGNEIVLFIKDEGQGIPSDLLERIGTPFVTKETGTGLGLAVCYSIAAP